MMAITIAILLTACFGWLGSVCSSSLSDLNNYSPCSHLGGIKRDRCVLTRLHGLLPTALLGGGSQGSTEVLSNFSTSYCNTTFISCDREKRIVSLRLPRRHEQVVLPAVIGALEMLSNLDLSYGNYTGPVPIEWGHLRRMKLLNLTGNPAVTGHLPPEWRSVGRLTRRQLQEEVVIDLTETAIDRSWRLSTDEHMELCRGAQGPLSVNFDRGPGAQTPHRLTTDKNQQGSICGAPPNVVLMAMAWVMWVLVLISLATVQWYRAGSMHPATHSAPPEAQASSLIDLGQMMDQQLADNSADPASWTNPMRVPSRSRSLSRSGASSQGTEMHGEVHGDMPGIQPGDCTSSIGPQRKEPPLGQLPGGCGACGAGECMGWASPHQGSAWGRDHDWASTTGHAVLTLVDVISDICVVVVMWYCWTGPLVLVGVCLAQLLGSWAISSYIKHYLTTPHWFSRHWFGSQPQALPQVTPFVNPGANPAAAGGVLGWGQRGPLTLGTPLPARCALGSHLYSMAGSSSSELEVYVGCPLACDGAAVVVRGDVKSNRGHSRGAICQCKGVQKGLFRGATWLVFGIAGLLLPPFLPVLLFVSHVGWSGQEEEKKEEKTRGLKRCVLFHSFVTTFTEDLVSLLAMSIVYFTSTTSIPLWAVWFSFTTSLVHSLLVVAEVFGKLASRWRADKGDRLSAGQAGGIGQLGSMMAGKMGSLVEAPRPWPVPPFSSSSSASSSGTLPSDGAMQGPPVQSWPPSRSPTAPQVEQLTANDVSKVDQVKEEEQDPDSVETPVEEISPAPCGGRRTISGINAVCVSLSRQTTGMTSLGAQEQTTDSDEDDHGLVPGAGRSTSSLFFRVMTSSELLQENRTPGMAYATRSWAMGRDGGAERGTSCDSKEFLSWLEGTGTKQEHAVGLSSK